MLLIAVISRVNLSSIRTSSSSISINRSLTIFQNRRGKDKAISILPRNPVRCTMKLRFTRGIIMPIMLTILSLIAIGFHRRTMGGRYRPTGSGRSICPIVCLRRGRCRGGGRLGSLIIWTEWSRGWLVIRWTSNLQGRNRLNVCRLFPSS